MRNRKASRDPQGLSATLDERTAATPFVRKALRYVFPDHWSFLLGEVALYSFVVLVATGVYLTLFFEPSTRHVVYHGSYAPLQGAGDDAGVQVGRRPLARRQGGPADPPDAPLGGRRVRRAIVLHLLRVFFTGAFRKPRELTYYIGVTMLMLALLEGYLGYSLVDDLLSGMGLAIGYSVAMSIPFVGANLAQLIWGGPFPGAPDVLAAHVHRARLPVPDPDRDAARRCTCCSSRCGTTRSSGRRAQTERASSAMPMVPG